MFWTGFFVILAKTLLAASSAEVYTQLDVCDLIISSFRNSLLDLQYFWQILLKLGIILQNI